MRKHGAEGECRVEVVGEGIGEGHVELMLQGTWFMEAKGDIAE